MTTPATMPVPAVLAGQRLVVVDVEGNGQNPPEIIEIAALPVEDTVTYADMRSWLVRPQMPIKAVVTRTVHGISNRDVEDSPAWSDVRDEVTEALAGRVLVAHGAHVERRVLGAHLPDWTPPLVLDTLRLTKRLWPDLPSYSLPKLVEHLRLDVSAVASLQQHRAGYDTWCAWQLLHTLLDGSDLSWDDLATGAALPTVGKQVSAADPEGGLW